MSWKKELNAAQLEAVLVREGPVLVLAGAGTGKTKTIVSRLAQLVSSGVPASSILLLTFTRKAAREMILRASFVGDKRCAEVQGGTFHSFCSGVLRRFAPVLGISSGFTILDDSDTLDVFQFLRNEKDFGKTKSRFPSNETLISIYGEIRNTGKSLRSVLEKDYPCFYKKRKISPKSSQTINRIKRNDPFWITTIYSILPEIFLPIIRKSETHFPKNTDSSWWMSFKIRTRSKHTSSVS